MPVHLTTQASQETPEPMQLGSTCPLLNVIGAGKRAAAFTVASLDISVSCPEFFGKSFVLYRYSLQAWVNSGAAGNFMDISLAKKLSLPSKSLSSPQVVTALDGRPLGHGEIINQTLPQRLAILQHQEISFYLIQSSAFPLILG